jgi:ATP-dependent DNA helicase RecG
VTDHSSFKLATPIQYLPGVGPARADRLAKLGLHTAQDVLFLFPRDYEFPAPAAGIDRIKEGETCSLLGRIADAELISRTPGKSVFAAIVENETGAVRILFFNQPFRAEQLTLDRRVLITGVPKLNGLRMEFSHPKVTILDEQEQLPSPRILPVYPLTEGIKQSEMRRLAQQVSQMLASELSEVMPESLRHRAAEMLRSQGMDVHGDLPGIDEALRELHFPSDEQGLLRARTRLVFQEWFVLQLALAMRHRRLTSELRAPSLPSSAMIDARIMNRFPFELTGDQKRSIAEIREDMSRQFPMNRLLQGDVGSGKTLVAIYAMMLAVANRHQAVLMAPTEVLARQHYQTLQRILADSRVRVGLLCGSLSAGERRAVVEATRSGEVEILVGTQALLHGGIAFHQLGLCVIDEQHKFGVAQRDALRSGGVDPHYLVMSATPIPRSVAMTLFGDVDLSTLRQQPPGRGKVSTYLAHDGWKSRWWEFVRQRLNEGRQAYVVAPRVASDRTERVDEIDVGEEQEDVTSVESVFEELCNGPLCDYRVGLLHGRMGHEAKQRVMESFAAGRLQVLVTTTVVEVGIDVPNATVMTILGAQRFGLAQLHQLRGRVSRGAHAGHVCVFTDGEGSPEENERLKIFSETDDGFALAEADFRLRGPGDVFGRSQSGLPPMRIADLERDFDVLVVARQLAKTMVEADPQLQAEELAELRRQVMRRYGERLDLGDVA